MARHGGRGSRQLARRRAFAAFSTRRYADAFAVRGSFRFKETQMLEMYEQLKTMVDGIEDDVRKAAGGNKAAGTRVRKQMQDVKNLAQELRKKVLENRDTE
jgi:uncharacterized protein YifE (UPF0438 family)